MAFSPSQSLPVIRAADFVVTSGANLGDALTDLGELTLDDVYGLRPTARRLRLNLTDVDGDRHFRLTEGSEAGSAGNDIFLDSALTFMSPDGSTLEGLVFVETGPGGVIAGCYFLPMAPVEIRRDYALVAIDGPGARARMAGIAGVSFAKGTHISMASGLQRRIEELEVGDRVLTRDNGAREIRWIGRQTVRATGSFAPIRIAKGVLNNSGDLMVSPNHRLFIWQRRDNVRAGRAEVMVRAGQLVNGTSVVQTEGGFVDYYQLLFDRHEIIYAEGIAAESLLADTRVRPALPEDVLRRIRPEADPRAHFEIGEGDPEASFDAELLRRASAC